MKQKKKDQKRTKKIIKNKNFRKKVKKKTSKISFKKAKNIIINKHIKQLKHMNLLLKTKKKQIIKNQINLLKGISLHRFTNFTSHAFNKACEDFKKKQKIKKLKKIKLEKKEKTKQKK